jgi:protein involved in polysaccharide export with SLBB domain
MTHDEKISKRQGKTEGCPAAHGGARASIPGHRLSFIPQEPSAKNQTPNSKGFRFGSWHLVLGSFCSASHLVIVIVSLLCGLLSGCAALTNPVANGVPVRRLPPELLGEPKEGERSLPLTLLRQKPPEPYRLGPGDLLGIWIEGELGERGQPPPINFPETRSLPPAVGVPIPVRADGTVSLPRIEPVKVQGLSVEEAQVKIGNAYTTKKILPPEARIMVSLMRRRVEQILVFREDAGALAGPTPVAAGVAPRAASITLGAGGTAASLKRGAAFAVDLPAGENDVLHALAQTGGLPGLDAVNEVVIQRGYFQDSTDREALLQELEALAPGCRPPGAAATRNGGMVRIPLRLRPGEVPSLRPEDIILHTGDIVFIEAREAEYFYTGGILPPGQYVIPRDYDLDVVQAISLVGGPMVSGGLNPINLAGTFVAGGIGFPSPSLVSVIRRTPGGGQVAIRVDLNRALRDPRERILIQPRDVILLQETPSEATTRYVTQVFKFIFVWTPIHGPHETGTTTLAVP